MSNYQKTKESKGKVHYKLLPKNAPMTYYMKSKNNEMYGNRIIAQRDSYATINRFTGLLYENGVYPVSKDHLNVMSTVNYIMAKTKQTQKEYI